MDNQLALRIDADWAARNDRLRQRVNEAAGWLRDILDVERHHSEGHSRGQLKAALGSFGGQVLDTRAMSEVLGRVAEGHKTDAARSGRVTELLARLDLALQEWNTAVGGPCHLPVEQGSEAALAKAAEVLDRFARLFGTLRQAAMERHGRYREELHQTFFAQFGRQHLDSSELALCPPLLATVPASGRLALGTVMELLGSGLPIKVLLLGAPGTGSRGGAIARSGGGTAAPDPADRVRDAGLVAPAGFEGLLSRALASPRAALLSLVWSEAVPIRMPCAVRPRR
jgi:hypothetical protein